jgi:hypothetical protein
MAEARWWAAPRWVIVWLRRRDRHVDVEPSVMIPTTRDVKVSLATGYTDMRKGFPGLALQVQEVLRRDPMSGPSSSSAGAAAITRNSAYGLRFAMVAYRWNPLFGRRLQVSPFRHGKELMCIYIDGVSVEQPTPALSWMRSSKQSMIGAPCDKAD